MKILFGAIITSGRGKIGGQFVKRLKNGHSLNNLMNTKSKSYLRNFANVQTLSFIFRSWRDVSNIERDLWADAAVITPVIDTFGNSKFLTARQFFTKCIAQGWFRREGIFSAVGFTTLVGSANFGLGATVISEGEIMIVVGAVLQEGDFYLRFDKLSGTTESAHYINSNVLHWFHVAVSGSFNFFDQFVAKFPTAYEGEYYQVSLTPVNEYGWLGTPQTIKFVLS